MAKTLPSIKTLASIAFERAKELRAVLEITTNAELDKALETGKYPATVAWITQCYNGPKFHEIKMSICDEIVPMSCGVELIPSGKGSNSPRIEYCNRGDGYRSTLLFVRGRYKVGCWADIVERGNYA